MDSKVSKMNKRSLFDAPNVDYEELKRIKQEDCKKKRYGDGVAWFRGKLIGEGSYGCVFIANLKNPNSRYNSYPPIMAVKSAEVSVSGSIQKEKEVMDNIVWCPNVIKCLGEEITNGSNGQMVYNLLLEYGAGGTLADVIKSSDGKGLPEFDVRRYARSMLLGLNHIHGKGYVHCDLKPQNVLLVANRKNGGFVAKIGDLGMAKRMKRAKKVIKRNNLNGCYRGTPMYLSPEAVVNNGAQKPPADIWAFGCIVFEMLTGRSLWSSSQDSGLDEILRRIHDENGSAFVSCGISTEARSFLKGCLCRKVMCRLSAKMLLDHPFVQGLRKDNVYEVVESHEVFDINAITSSSIFSDDDDDDSSLSSCSDESSDNLQGNSIAMENKESIEAKFHQVQRFPVALTISKGV